MNIRCVTTHPTFTSAGVTQAFAGKISGIDKGKRFSAGRVVAAAAVGGTASRLSGGKFVNGAKTGAFSRMFNDEAHYQNLKEAIRVGLYRGRTDLQLQKNIWENCLMDTQGYCTKVRVPMVGNFVSVSDYDLKGNYTRFWYEESEYAVGDGNYVRARLGKRDIWGGGRPSDIKALIITQDHDQELSRHYYNMSRILESRVYVQFANESVKIYEYHNSRHKVSCEYTGEVSCY